MKDGDRTTRLAFNYAEASMRFGERRHALVLISELGDKLGFRIQTASAHPAADAWQFIVVGDFDHSALPDYVKVVGPTKLARPVVVKPPSEE